MTTVIHNIFNAITNNDTKILLNNLDLLPIKGLDIVDANKLLAWFLNRAVNHPETFMFVLNYWNTHGLPQKFPTDTGLFINPDISETTLQYLVQIRPEKTIKDYFLDIMNYDNSPNLDLKIIHNIVKAFESIEDISAETWQDIFDLYILDEEDDNEYTTSPLYGYILDKLKDTNISKPFWVKEILEIDSTTLLPLESAINKLPNKDAAVKLLYEGMKKSGIKFPKDDNKALEVMRNQYGISTIQERIEMLKGTIEIPNFDEEAENEIFHMFGPVNSLGDVLINDKCKKYGGCRMLKCNDFEDLDLNGIEIDIMSAKDIDNDWYRGTCDVCEKDIFKKCYAVRKPLLGGGWKGCYCSWKCVVSKEKDVETLTLIGRVEKQLDELGIKDREDF